MAFVTVTRVVDLHMTNADKFHAAQSRSVKTQSAHCGTLMLLMHQINQECAIAEFLSGRATGCSSEQSERYCSNCSYLLGCPGVIGISHLCPHSCSRAHLLLPLKPLSTAMMTASSSSSLSCSTQREPLLNTQLEKVTTINLIRGKGLAFQGKQGKSGHPFI